jgi:hypothetical protein
LLAEFLRCDRGSSASLLCVRASEQTAQQNENASGTR